MEVLLKHYVDGVVDRSGHGTVIESRGDKSRGNRLIRDIEEAVAARRERLQNVRRNRELSQAARNVALEVGVPREIRRIRTACQTHQTARGGAGPGNVPSRRAGDGDRNLLVRPDEQRIGQNDLSGEAANLRARSGL